MQLADLGLGQPEVALDIASPRGRLIHGHCARHGGFSFWPPRGPGRRDDRWPGTPRQAVVWDVVYFVTWEGEGSRASRPRSGEFAIGTALARSAQADGEFATPGTTSEPETALPLTNGKQDAGAAQHRPGCRASS